MEKMDDELFDKEFSICSPLVPSCPQALHQLQKKAQESIVFYEERSVAQQASGP